MFLGIPLGILRLPVRRSPNRALDLGLDKSRRFGPALAPSGRQAASLSAALALLC